MTRAVALPAIFAPTWGKRWMIGEDGRLCVSAQGGEWKLVLQVAADEVQVVANALDYIAVIYDSGHRAGEEVGDARRLARIQAALEPGPEA